jgi:hypothetical protein
MIVVLNLNVFKQKEGFAPAGATKGLSGRPLETFGSHLHVYGIM